MIGPGGAGKTTLLHCIAGVHSASGGEIHFAGSDVAGWAAHRVARAGIARTFQPPALFEGLTLGENLLAGAYLRGRSGLLRGALMTPRVKRERREAQIVARDILVFLGLARSADAIPATPLGGPSGWSWGAP